MGGGRLEEEGAELSGSPRIRWHGLFKNGRENMTMRLNRLGCCHVGKKD